uniref:Uncharacterized protein n=1 Tax=viral metagenome TaxID=1070528 RepID=A0A6M3LR90_9ZZZZ
MPDLADLADQLADCRKRCEKLLEACEDLCRVLIRTHPTPNDLKGALVRGELERRLKTIGAEIFDPTGRIRALLKGTAAIREAKGEKL